MNNVLVSGLLKGATTRPVVLALRPEIVELCLLIYQRAEIVQVEKKIELCRDPKDNIVLECAVAAEADFIVTNDEDLLVLGEIEETKIVSSLSFLELMKQ